MEAGDRENAGLVTVEKWRKRLRQRLKNVSWPLPETLFVLLWSFFKESGVRRIENLLTSLGEHSLYVELFKLPEEKKFHKEALKQGVASLLGLRGLDFDLAAVRWLATLDRVVLKNRQPEPTPIRGLYGDRRFRVYRRNPFLAGVLGPGPASEGEQSRTIEAVLRHNKAVSVDELQDYRIESYEDWDPNLRHRLQFACGEGHFKVLLCPLKTPVTYPDLPDLGSIPRSAGGGAAFFHLRQISNEVELLTELPEVLAFARDQSVTLLILPELCISDRSEEEIRRILGTHGQDGYPTLTLFGRCHRRNAAGNLDLNEAVLLGPDGSDILQYRKQTRYTGRHVVAWDDDTQQDEGEFSRKPVPIYLEEQIELGDRLLVVDFPFGNLAPLICLDLLHIELGDILRQSHADLFAVPSLSETTGAHRSSATRLMISNRASTFVTNRWIENRPGEPSFYRIPVEKGMRQHQAQEDGPYLLFCLEAFLNARQQEREEEDKRRVDSQVRVN